MVGTPWVCIVAKPVKLSTLAVKHDVQVVLNPTCDPQSIRVQNGCLCMGCIPSMKVVHGGKPLYYGRDEVFEVDFYLEE